MVLAASGRAGVDVIVIDTDPGPSTEAGGVWWDVAVPAVSERQLSDQHIKTMFRNENDRKRVKITL